jgi:DNA-binding CsgD family transcriptional regulator
MLIMWTKKEEIYLSKLFNEGKTNKEIGIIFNKKPDAIGMKLKRLGLIRDKKIYTEIIVCNCCSKEFEALISEKRKYCSLSCATKINNSKTKKRKKDKFCSFCGNKMLSHYKKFCSKECKIENKKKTYFSKIEENNIKDLAFATAERWVKKYLIDKYGEKCMKCGWCKVHPITKKIPIQLNHIDGNSDNNNLDNVELLCPNCHSLTPNFGSLNIGSGRTKRKIDRNNRNKKMSVYSSGLRE